MAERVLVGIVVGAQGIRGRVRIKSFTADPASVGAYGPLSDETGKRRFALQVVGESRGAVLAQIEGVADRNAAEALKGLRLYAERAALPPAEEDEYYQADLVGLAVEDTAGRRIGRVEAVREYGAAPLLEVARPGETSVLVPFSQAVVPVVDVPGGRLVIDPPPGLLDQAGTGGERPEGSPDGGPDADDGRRGP